MIENKKYALYIGRFSPFHLGHDYIIRKKLDEGKSVLIACRDTLISEQDPYSAEERVQMISEHYKDDDVKVIVMPDIESVNIGRKVGYDINRYDSPENIEGISATQIRQMMDDNNNDWKNKVPKAIADFLTNKKNASPEGLVIWFTGLSGSGKSTLAQSIKPHLERTGKKVKILDGDEIRKNLTSDLGFSREDRAENIKRISYVAKSIADCDGIAICAAISPYEEDRQKAKEFIGENRFFSIYTKCDIETLKERDTKGLYKKAINGEIKNFTGISDPYEEPLDANCIVYSGLMTIEESVSFILTQLNFK